MINKLEQQFVERFNQSSSVKAFAPGRINLIGEHTDYNGGYVFPAAIELGTYGVASLRQDRELHFYSNNFKEDGEIITTLDSLDYNGAHQWANYAKGMIKYLREQFDDIDCGFNILIEGNIPNGASLSSSASLELLIGWLIKALFKLNINRLELIHLGQRVENQYIGVNSGIMDQFIVGMGKKDHAILLDTANLHYHYVPAQFGDYVISIMNTNKRRSLTESKYNERRSECETALKDLQKEADILSLGELSVEQFDSLKHHIKASLPMRRARHAVTENQRTKEAYQALQQRDFKLFGQLLNDSHHSLKNDYAVTGVELDTLAETAQQVDGVLGARMTGAGFAGCAIALVHKAALKQLEYEVTSVYKATIGYEPSFYHVTVGDGVKTLG
ncbi:galactokinase [Staphylococcus sp. SQ8-PEA]|uniref:Galactokinase n=1 Tax=Staphylococcus marylandisciuri TaxID=2981529 RepID=A0ABT2QMK3_9STAP|nr:galactokinase [Staphylococcus marylandisciuri]MCU5745190.1 galactokinase [Staphylococcus marylandisciuri]